MQDYKHTAKISFILTLLCCIAALPLFGDAPQTTLHSPHNTVFVHLHYLQPNSFEPAKAAKTIRDNNARQLAIELKQILDGKGLRVQLSQIPQDSMYQDSLSNQPIYVLFPTELPEVYVEKVGNQWFYAQETVAAIPQLHKEVYPFGSDVLVKLFPKFGQYTVLGLQLWQYFGVLLLFIFTFLTYKLFNVLIHYGLRFLNQSDYNDYIKDTNLLERIIHIASMLVVLWFVMRLLPILQLPIDTAAAFIVGLSIARIILLVNLFLRGTDMGVLYLKSITEKTTNTLDDQLLPIVKRTLYTIFIIGGIIQILSLLEVNVTALIAGISIGGLALALAAQDTVKNLIGSIMIFIDRPFQIGDVISTSAISGVVEEVGFRSTRIRTFENSLTTVPNGMLANMVVDNIGMRIYRRFRMELNVTYQTPPEQLEQFIQGIRDLLQLHPNTRKEGQTVYFNNLNQSALVILVQTHLTIGTWDEELQTRQDLLLAMLELASLLNIQFAYPSSTVFVENNNPKIVSNNSITTAALIQAYKEKWGVA